MWYLKSAEETVKELRTDLVTGLSSQEAAKRLEEWGPNKLAEARKKPYILLFLEQLNDAMIYILIAAAVVSGLLGEISDRGHHHGRRPGQRLRRRHPGGQGREGPRGPQEARESPGRSQARWPARRGRGGRHSPRRCHPHRRGTRHPLRPPLGGKASTSRSRRPRSPASRCPSRRTRALCSRTRRRPWETRRNMGYLSTQATYGRGVGIAVGTGMRTEIGNIATMLGATEVEPTPLQKKIGEFGKRPWHRHPRTLRRDVRRRGGVGLHQARQVPRHEPPRGVSSSRR